METLSLILKLAGLFVGILAGYIAFLFFSEKVIEYLAKACRDDTAERH